MAKIKSHNHEVETKAINVHLAKHIFPASLFLLNVTDTPEQGNNGTFHSSFSFIISQFIGTLQSIITY